MNITSICVNEVKYSMIALCLPFCLLCAHCLIVEALRNIAANIMADRYRGGDDDDAG